MRRLICWWMVFASGVLWGGCAAHPPRPRLVVVLVVDQMRSDYLSRFDDLFTGGFRRLLDEGAVCVNAAHNHASTYTATGHATIATGCHPSRHGIVGNSWYDRLDDNRSTYAIADDEVHELGDPERRGGSPRLMKRPALGDWLKASSPGSKVFAVALKDRAAVALGGRQPDGAYWYDRRTGTFCTSTYYRQDYPAWVEAYNARHPADAWFADVWTRLLPDSAYARSRGDAFPAENDGIHTSFPYSPKNMFGEPGEPYYRWLRESPAGDRLVLDFAGRLLSEEGLGTDDAPDVLFVGCSAADGCGHTWGPFSQEVEDYYLRLDGYLDEFFELLDERVGRGRYTVVLSADHGVMPLPEALSLRGENAERVLWDDARAAVTAAAARAAADLGVEGELIGRLSEGVALDYRATDARGLPRGDVQAAVAARIRDVPYVADVYTRAELAAGGTDRPFCDLYVRGLDPDRGPDLFIRLRENVLVSSDSHGTTHGSPYAYDRRVPMVFAGAGIAPGRRVEAVYTVDIAPTLGRLLGAKVPDVDGRVLAEVLAVR